MFICSHSSFQVDPFASFFFWTERRVLGGEEFFESVIRGIISVQNDESLMSLALKSKQALQTFAHPAFGSQHPV